MQCLLQLESDRGLPGTILACQLCEFQGLRIVHGEEGVQCVQCTESDATKLMQRICNEICTERVLYWLSDIVIQEGLCIATMEQKEYKAILQSVCSTESRRENSFSM